MTYEQIVERIENILKAASEMAEATKIYPKSLFEGIYPEILDLINRQQEQLEAAANGQETLQKALADKDREAAELNSDLKLLRNDYYCLKRNFDDTVEKNKRLRDKAIRLTAEKDSLIKTFGECQKEAVREFAERLKEEQSFYDGQETRIYLTEKDLDNLVKEMAGDTE